MLVKHYLTLYLHRRFPLRPQWRFRHNQFQLFATLAHQMLSFLTAMLTWNISAKRRDGATEKSKNSLQTSLSIFYASTKNTAKN